jgi:hypothetical protein
MRLASVQKIVLREIFSGQFGRSRSRRSSAANGIAERRGMEEEARWDQNLKR